MGKQLAKRQSVEKSPAERFRITTERLMAESTGMNVELSDHQKRLMQGYFVMVDMALAETKKKTDKGPVSLTWNDINMQKLATAVVANAQVGLDPSIKNHMSAIAYYNSDEKNYVINLQRGYVGTEFIARTHSLDPIRDIVFELVYSNDAFKVVKKGGEGVETYEFAIKNPFDRGKLIGGFGYVIYEDARKNKVITMSKTDMDKRRKAAKTQTIWNAWEDEMYYKTLVNFVCSPKNIPLNPASIADYSRHLRMKELEFAKLEAKGALVPVGYDAEYKEVGADDDIAFLDFGGAEAKEEEEEEEVAEVEAPKPKQTKSKAAAKKQDKPKATPKPVIEIEGEEFLEVDDDEPLPFSMDESGVQESFDDLAFPE